MPSFVKINKDFVGVSPLEKKSIFPFENFFCKEDPKQVLEFLAADYFIGRYKHIYLPERTFAEVQNKNVTYTITFDLSILEAAAPLGTEIVNSVKDFDMSFIKQNNVPKYFNNNQNALLSDLITRVLVYVYANSYRAAEVPKVEKIKNYLIDRKETINEDYEQKLNDILELSSVFLKKDITVDDLEKTKLHLPKIGEEYLRISGINC